MKQSDWKPYAIPLLVKCFNTAYKRPLGVEFKIRASGENEANMKVQQVLEKHHPNFLSKTQGVFQTRFAHIPE